MLIKFKGRINKNGNKKIVILNLIVLIVGIQLLKMILVKMKKILTNLKSIYDEFD